MCIFQYIFNPCPLVEIGIIVTISVLSGVIGYKLGLSNNSNDELSNDESSNDELSNDEEFNDEEFNNEEFNNEGSNTEESNNEESSGEGSSSEGSSSEVSDNQSGERELELGIGVGGLGSDTNNLIDIVRKSSEEIENITDDNLIAIVRESTNESRETINNIVNRLVIVTKQLAETLDNSPHIPLNEKSKIDTLMKEVPQIIMHIVDGKESKSLTDFNESEYLMNVLASLE